MFSSSFREEILCNAFRGQPDVIDAKDVDAVKRAVDIRPLLEALVGMQSRDIPYTPNKWKTCISLLSRTVEMSRRNFVRTCWPWWPFRPRRKPRTPHQMPDRAKDHERP